jgi:large subunit ribosomal protein L29
VALKNLENKPLRPAQARELSPDELKQELAKLEEALFRLKFRSATEAIESPMQFRMIRRNIARLKTLLKEKARG